MTSHPGLLSTAEEIAQLADHLKNHEVIAFDTEFIRESTFFPIVELIQIATEQDSWLVDAQAFKKSFPKNDPNAFDPGLRPLLDIFENKKILKVLHAAQGDQECLYTSFGVVASPSLDTAVAASLCGHGDGIGLGKLLKQVLDVTVAKGHARTNWSVRPLPAQLIEYAHADVTHLVLLGKTLLNQLEKEGRRAWALELSAKWEDARLYQSDVEGMAQKLARSGRLDKKGYAALLELVRWREDRVRHLNLPRRWVADDHVLIDLAHVKPKDTTHLGAFRGLNKGELKNSGETILAAIRKGLENAEGLELTVQKGPRVEIPSAEEAQILELLRCYVAILADRHRIAAKHLMTAAKLLPLLRSQPKTIADLEKTEILGGEAVGMIGEDLIALIQGKRALRIKNNQIEIMNVDP